MSRDPEPSSAAPESTGYSVNPGMDIRTWLAGQAITAAASIEKPLSINSIKDALGIANDSEPTVGMRSEYIAKLAVQIADAIIVELEKPE